MSRLFYSTDRPVLWKDHLPLTEGASCRETHRCPRWCGGVRLLCFPSNERGCLQVLQQLDLLSGRTRWCTRAAQPDSLHLKAPPRALSGSPYISSVLLWSWNDKYLLLLKLSSLLVKKTSGPSLLFFSNPDDHLYVKFKFKYSGEKDFFFYLLLKFSANMFPWKNKPVILPTHFSMAETCFVSIFPFVRSSGVIRPSNSSPSLAILTRMSRTSSPMYIPLAIFSNLTREKHTSIFRRYVVDTISHSIFSMKSRSTIDLLFLVGRVQFWKTCHSLFLGWIL